MALNSLGVLAVAEALGADVGRGRRRSPTCARLRAAASAGRIAVGGREALLIDESYNANPASMRAALGLLGQMPGRRVAVLGDMLELGERAAELHAALAAAVARAGVDLVFTCGPHMARLHEALPAAGRGAHAPDSASLVAARPGRPASRRRLARQGFPRQPDGAASWRRWTPGRPSGLASGAGEDRAFMLYTSALPARGPVRARSTSSATSPSAPAAPS